MHTLNEGAQEELGITTSHSYDDHSDGGYGLEAPSAAHSGFITESEFYSSPAPPNHTPHGHNSHGHHQHSSGHAQHQHNHLTHHHHHALQSMQEVKFHPLQPQHHSPSASTSPYNNNNNNNNNNNTNGTSNGSSKSTAFISRGNFFSPFSSLSMFVCVSSSSKSTFLSPFPQSNRFQLL